MTELKACNHTKDDGSPCNAIPVHDTPYCYFHRKYYNPPALPGDKNYQAPLLESHQSVQIALTQLYQSFLVKKIDMKEANFGLRVLQLASRTVVAIEKATKQVAANPPAVSETTRKLPTEEDLFAGKFSPADLRAFAREIFVEPPADAAPPTTTPQPKRGVWDPYGCLTPAGSRSKK